MGIEARRITIGREDFQSKLKDIWYDYTNGNDEHGGPTFITDIVRLFGRSIGVVTKKSRTGITFDTDDDEFIRMVDNKDKFQLTYSRTIYNWGVQDHTKNGIYAYNIIPMYDDLLKHGVTHLHIPRYNPEIVGELIHMLGVPSAIHQIYMGSDSTPWTITDTDGKRIGQVIEVNSDFVEAVLDSVVAKRTSRHYSPYARFDVKGEFDPKGNNFIVSKINDIVIEWDTLEDRGRWARFVFEDRIKTKEEILKYLG